VHAALVRERVLAHVGLGVVRRAVEQLVDVVRGRGQVRELRRPKHSGSVAMDGTTGKLTYGASLTYSSAHLDVRDRLPFDVLRLDSYWLAGARVAYALTSNVEIFARAANVLNSRYEDVSGYRTEGRSLYAGLRLSRR